jgi:hypothetical protein
MRVVCCFISPRNVWTSSKQRGFRRRVGDGRVRRKQRDLEGLGWREKGRGQFGVMNGITVVVKSVGRETGKAVNGARPGALTECVVW